MAEAETESQEVGQMTTEHTAACCQPILAEESNTVAVGLLDFPEAGATYVNQMLTTYDRVASTEAPNFQGAQVPVPTNLNIDQWRAIAKKPSQHRIVDFLLYGFPEGYEGPIPTPSISNHTSATNHLRDVAIYICEEVQHGVILGPFPHPSFHPWCQTSPLMTQPKRGSHNRQLQVILDLSWPHLPHISVNRGTPKNRYIRTPTTMHLASPADFADHICRAGRVDWLYSTDIARAYRQLPLDPRDWPLICFTKGGWFFIDIIDTTLWHEVGGLHMSGDNKHSSPAPK